mmetsp:Transcript_14117/g.29868  ORF Transcript_14117/g.29868 Transcript_14117/m.29868 type:complete len:440 (+) Transcript_14117:1-1320(+)
MGFDCVWITPVVKQISGTSCNHQGYCGTGFHGYWAEDWWSIDPHLGTPADLLSLSRALHARQMCLVLDVVVNHVRPIHSSSDVVAVSPFNSTLHYHTLQATPGESFDAYAADPVPADPTHGCALGEESCAGYDSTAVLDGWFADLGDLRQEDPYVAATLLQWARQMVATYAVDALRLDTAAYVPAAFLSSLQSAAAVDILGEVTTANVSFHAAYQRSLRGLLNFPLATAIPPAFCSSSPDLRALAAVATQQAAAAYASLDLLANFADNHDLPRLSRTCAAAAVPHALAFVMLHRGVPVVYYGTEQGFAQQDARTSLWQTRFRTDTRLYALLAALSAVRREVRALPLARAAFLHADRSSLVFSRGEGAFVFLNNHHREEHTPRRYCLPPPARLPPLPPEGRVWVEALSGREAVFDREANCLLAPTSAPQVLVLRENASHA